MARSTFSDLDCSIARTLDIVGSRWTLLVLRDLFAGITRFDAIQADLGISRKVLAERLASLEQDGWSSAGPTRTTRPAMTTC